MLNAIVLQNCTVLGCAGFPYDAGDKITLAFEGSTVNCSNAQYHVTFSLVELVDITVSGPGTVVSGGGFVGGGFGVDGALEGMAMAGVLNALTTSKKVHTFLALTTNFGELHLHYAGMEPAALRIFLGGVYTQLRHMDQPWRQARLQRIEDQLTAGLLTVEEAEACRVRLAATPVWPAVVPNKPVDPASLSGPKGTCPSCDKIILLSSETCPYCQANFGEYSSWQVRPLKA